MTKKRNLFEPEGLLTAQEPQTHEFAMEANMAVDTQVNKPKLQLWFVALALLIAIFTLRLTILQVIEGPTNLLLAQENHIRVQEIQPPRGLILDRNNEILASNIASFRVQLVPADLPRDRHEREIIYQELKKIFKLDPDQLKQKIEASGLFSLEPIILKDNLVHTEALKLKIELQDLIGVQVTEFPQRQYAKIPGLSHILGYTGKISKEELKQSSKLGLQSIVGKSGIEQFYENFLQGQPGRVQIEVDSRGRFERVSRFEPPKAGNTLKLTIDAKLQKILGAALKKKLQEVKSKAGVAIALDPNNGEVLAMVSLPDFPHQKLVNGLKPHEYEAMLKNPNQIFTNRAIAGVYPSGSTIKPVVAAGALADQVITAQTTIDAPGAIRIGEFVFPDWKVHGLVDVKKAIAVSSNVFFYAVGGGWGNIKGLGVQRLTYYLRLFGFGKKTGIDLNGEAQGLVPDEAWKQKNRNEPWYIGDTYHLAIGQGDFLTTPLQLTRAIAIIANGGRKITPHLVARPTNKSQKQLIDQEVIEIVRQGMRQAVLEGSARRLQALGVTSGGKTGTAQFGNEGKTHSWFTAFAPYEDPKIVILVLIEGGGEGHKAALPVALEGLEWYFDQTVKSPKYESR